MGAMITNTTCLIWYENVWRYRLSHMDYYSASLDLLYHICFLYTPLIENTYLETSMGIYWGYVPLKKAAYWMKNGYFSTSISSQFYPPEV